MAHSHGSWQDLGSSPTLAEGFGSLHIGLKGHPECSHDMAAGFSRERDLRERARRKLQYLIMTYP